MRTNGGLHKIMRLDEKLSALIGVEEDSRAQVTVTKRKQRIEGGDMMGFGRRNVERRKRRRNVEKRKGRKRQKILSIIFL